MAACSPASAPADAPAFTPAIAPALAPAFAPLLLAHFAPNDKPAAAPARAAVLIKTARAVAFFAKKRKKSECLKMKKMTVKNISAFSDTVALCF